MEGECKVHAATRREGSANKIPIDKSVKSIQYLLLQSGAKESLMKGKKKENYTH